MVRTGEEIRLKLHLPVYRRKSALVQILSLTLESLAEILHSPIRFLAENGCDKEIYGKHFGA